MLPVIAIATLYLRHKASPQEARPGLGLTAALWIASILTIGMMALSAFYA
jgi:hypothetical protein